jgi:hypothetical protein
VLVAVSATAAGAEIADIRSASLAPGVVGEVCVLPDETSVETSAAVDITATAADGTVQTVHRSLPVFPAADERAHDAQPYFSAWVAWLADNHPELGIDAATDWQPTFVSNFLVVSHYAYWSDDWEMVIAWHNMIPPDDWTDVFLRHRDTENAYSIAFRQDSVANSTEPRPADLPETLIR